MILCEVRGRGYKGAYSEYALKDVFSKILLKQGRKPNINPFHAFLSGCTPKNRLPASEGTAHGKH